MNDAQDIAYRIIRDYMSKGFYEALINLNSDAVTQAESLVAGGYELPGNADDFEDIIRYAVAKKYTFSLIEQEERTQSSKEQILSKLDEYVLSIDPELLYDEYHQDDVAVKQEVRFILIRCIDHDLNCLATSSTYEDIYLAMETDFHEKFESNFGVAMNSEVYRLAVRDEECLLDKDCAYIYASQDINWKIFEIKKEG